jgi:hypothetical protein
VRSCWPTPITARRRGSGRPCVCSGSTTRSGFPRPCRSSRWTRASAGAARSVETLAEGLETSASRRITWREGTRGKLSARFCLRRVKVAQEDGFDPAKKDVVWLLMEWPKGERAPTKFYQTTLPRRWSKKQIVRHLKERWRTERAYEELKGELGLDHFEGRSFVGWHHHVSVVLCCYAFVVAERMRISPPRPPGRVQPVRSTSRPERHFADSFITIRLAIARMLVRWLPRCPCCHQVNPPRGAARDQRQLLYITVRAREGLSAGGSLLSANLGATGGAAERRSAANFPPSTDFFSAPHPASAGVKEADEFAIGGAIIVRRARFECIGVLRRGRVHRLFEGFLLRPYACLAENGNRHEQHDAIQPGSPHLSILSSRILKNRRDVNRSAVSPAIQMNHQGS